MAAEKKQLEAERQAFLAEKQKQEAAQQQSSNQKKNELAEQQRKLDERAKQQAEQQKQLDEERARNAQQKNQLAEQSTRQQQEAQRQLEEKNRQLQAELQKLADEKKQLEADRKAFLADKKKQESQKQISADAKKQLAEQQRQLDERAKQQAEQQKQLDAEKAKQEQQKNLLAEERAEQKKQLEAQNKQLLAEQKRLADEQKKLEAERQAFLAEKQRQEAELQRASDKQKNDLALQQKQIDERAKQQAEQQKQLDAEKAKQEQQKKLLAEESAKKQAEQQKQLEQQNKQLLAEQQKLADEKKKLETERQSYLAQRQKQEAEQQKAANLRKQEQDRQQQLLNEQAQKQLAQQKKLEEEKARQEEQKRLLAEEKKKSEEKQREIDRQLAQKTKSKEIPVEIAVVKKEPNAPQPQPLSPLKQNLEAVKTCSFEYYGTKMDARTPDKKFKLQGSDEKSMANAYRELTTDKYNNLLHDCLDLRKKYDLCDWAYYKLLESVGEAICGKGTQEAVFLQGVLFQQSGYMMRFALDEQKKLHLLVRIHDAAYRSGYTSINGQLFFLFDGSRLKNLAVCDVGFPGEKVMEADIDKLPKLKVDMSEMRTIISRFVSVSADIAVNKNMINFFNDYPSTYKNSNIMTNWAYYANTPITKEVKDKLYPQLKKQIQNGTKLMGANLLLNWVQMGLDYALDSKMWGRERAFFAEESLFYPKCDCEDRAILFSHLVRDLLGLDVVLVYYPEHMYTAVCFDEDVPGDYIMVEGRKFTVADPTYYNADVGKTMSRMDNSKAKVILLNRDL